MSGEDSREVLLIRRAKTGGGLSKAKRIREGVSCLCWSFLWTEQFKVVRKRRTHFRTPDGRVLRSNFVLILQGMRNPAWWTELKFLFQNMRPQREGEGQNRLRVRPGGGPAQRKELMECFGIYPKSAFNPANPAQPSN